MSESASCKICVYYKGKSDEPDFLFRVCDIHRNMEVQLSLMNALKPEDRELIGYTVVDPNLSICGKFLYSPLNDGFGQWFHFRKKKKRGKGPKD